jgi:hypothetical protein
MTRRHYPSDQVVDREIKRAMDLFGGVKSWELTPDGRVIVLPEAPAQQESADDELAAARKRRDANRHQGTR